MGNKKRVTEIDTEQRYRGRYRDIEVDREIIFFHQNLRSVVILMSVKTSDFDNGRSSLKTKSFSVIIVQ